MGFISTQVERRSSTGPLVYAQVETSALMLEPQLPAVATMLRDSEEEITA